MKVLQFINQQGTDEERTCHLLHLLQRIVDVSVPVPLVIILVAQSLPNGVEKLLTKSRQRTISRTIKFEPRDLSVDELAALVTLMPDRLRVEAQYGVECSGLPNTTQADNAEGISCRLEGIKIALGPRQRNANV